MEKKDLLQFEFATKEKYIFEMYFLCFGPFWVWGMTTHDTKNHNIPQDKQFEFLTSSK